MCLLFNPGPELPVVSFFGRILLPPAHHRGFWHGGTDVIVYPAFILPAILLRHLIDCGINAKTTAHIDEKTHANRLAKRIK